MKNCKHLPKILLLIIFVALAALSLCACIDSYGRPDDYVEVERLTIESANVYLSPSGVTSTYQLNVNILPETATNTKLIYYIPSEYLQYLLVSDSGLLSATGQTVPEGLIIPVKISSSTNKKAYLTVNVTIEYVAVTEINFETESVTLYLSQTHQVVPIFTPYHAQDGRGVTYSSLNEDVATVDSDGVIHPVAPGTTRILCTGSQTSGKIVTGRMLVKVIYAPGRYRLEVTDPNPQYNQVLGNFKAIHFSLLSLDPDSDPNIRIQWYVDTKRVMDLGTDARQYEHIPHVEARTSYYIKVVIDPDKPSDLDPQQILSSNLITIYENFAGFDLKFGNLDSRLADRYKYGDTVEFILTSGDPSIERYDWYLNRQEESGSGVKIAETRDPIHPDDPGKNLVKRLNIEGNFRLTAHAIKNDGTSSIAKEFNFSVSKFSSGDTLVIDPQLLGNGTPPETYNYFLSEYDDNGVITGSTVAIGHSSAGDTFNYTVPSAGNYIITANATLDGIIATVLQDVDGRNLPVPYNYTSPVLRFYSSTVADEERDNDIVSAAVGSKYLTSTRSTISDVVISGIYSDGENKVLLTWKDEYGVEDYTVELTKNGKTTVFGSGFSGCSFIVPSIEATLSDSFKVRIKADGQPFGETYYYNCVGTDDYHTYDKIATDAYPFLVPVNGNVTRYVRNMRELGDLMRYLIDYNPNNIDDIGNTILDGVRTLNFDIMLDFDLAVAEKYAYGELPENLGSLTPVYKALIGAQAAFCAPDDYKFFVVPLTNGGFNVKISRPSDVTISYSEAVEPSDKTSPTYSKNPYGVESSHPIDLRSAKSVDDGEQLYYAVQNGYKPVFVTPNGEAERIYDKALAVINGILDENMTDAQKVRAIFDYLTLNIKYDLAAAEKAENEESDYFYLAALRLNGVFDSYTAVCDGISKAFVLLCAIEGIRAERVTGLVDGKYHAWNKVLIDGKYYVVDCTNGLAGEEGEPNLDFFMLSDVAYAESFDSFKEYGELVASQA